MTTSQLREAINRIDHRDINDLATTQDVLEGNIRLYEEIESHDLLDVSHALNLMIGLNLSSICVYISSPGGSVYPSLAIYDLLVNASRRVKVDGVVEGLAASAAAMIVLQGCTKRYARAHSRIHLHEISKWVFMENQKESEVEDTAAEMKILTSVITDILSKRTGKSAVEIADFIKRRERWLSPSEALDFGLIDETLE